MAQPDIGGSFNRGQRGNGAGELMRGVMQLARIGLEVQRDKARQEHTEFLEAQSRERTRLIQESHEISLLERAESVRVQSLADKASREGTLAELSTRDLGPVGNVVVSTEVKQQADIQSLGKQQQETFNKQQSQDRLPAIGAEIFGAESPEFKIFEATVAGGDFEDARAQLKTGVKNIRAAAKGLTPAQEIALANSQLRAEELLIGGFVTKGSEAEKSVRAIKKRLNKLTKKEFGVEADSLQFGTQQSTGRRFIFLPNGKLVFLDTGEETTF